MSYLLQNYFNKRNTSFVKFVWSFFYGRKISQRTKVDTNGLKSTFKFNLSRFTRKRFFWEYVHSKWLKNSFLSPELPKLKIVRVQSKMSVSMHLPRMIHLIVMVFVTHITKYLKKFDISADWETRGYRKPSRKKMKINQDLKNYKTKQQQ